MPTCILFVASVIVHIDQSRVSILIFHRFNDVELDVCCVIEVVIVVDCSLGIISELIDAIKRHGASNFRWIVSGVIFRQE